MVKDDLSVPEKPIKKTWEWVEEKAKDKRAVWWLSWYSFLETVILPVPTDIFLGVMVLANRTRAIFLTFITTITSVLGAAVGYMIAALFFAVIVGPLIELFGMSEAVAQATPALLEYAFIAILLGAFTPFPFTPVVFASGFLNVDFFVFIVATLIGRSIRYALVSVLTVVFGPPILAHLSGLSKKHAVLVTLGATVLVVALYLLIT